MDQLPESTHPSPRTHNAAISRVGARIRRAITAVWSEQSFNDSLDAPPGSPNAPWREPYFGPRGGPHGWAASQDPRAPGDGSRPAGLDEQDFNESLDRASRKH